MIVDLLKTVQSQVKQRLCNESAQPHHHAPVRTTAYPLFWVIISEMKYDGAHTSGTESIFLPSKMIVNCVKSV